MCFVFFVLGFLEDFINCTFDWLGTVLVMPNNYITFHICPSFVLSFS